MNNKELPGIAVQIGLRNRAELIPLASPDWKEELGYQKGQDLCIPTKESDIQIPHQIADEIKTWKFFGIDRDIGSIAFMLQKYGMKGSWACANLAIYDNTRMHREWSPIEDVINKDYPFDREKDNWLYSAPIDMSKLFRDSSLHYIDVLMVDVDGIETVLFERYDWAIVPGFIKIELHPFGPKPYNTKNIQEIFESRNYEIKEVQEDKRNKGRQAGWINEEHHHMSFVHRAVLEGRRNPKNF